MNIKMRNILNRRSIKIDFSKFYVASNSNRWVIILQTENIVINQHQE